jgi:hypothetical protein
MIYPDRFCLFIKSVYFDLAKITHEDSRSNKWKINVSNEDLTIVDTFWIEDIWFEKGDQGRVPFSYDAASNFLHVCPRPWKHQHWQKDGFQTPIREREMGCWNGQIISARTKSDLRYGPIGSTMHIKVSVKGKDFPAEVTGYRTIDVRKMMGYFRSYRYNDYLSDSIAVDVDLSQGLGGIVLEVYPVTKISKSVRRRAVARGSGLSPHVIQKLMKKKLPDCCISVLKQLLRCIKTHQTVLNAWNLKGWAEKVLDPAWIMETAKKLRKEAYEKIKQELFPPMIPVDASLEGNTIQLSSLILANTMEYLTFGHMLDHSGDGSLYDIWYDIYQNFKRLKEEVVKKAGGEKSLKAKLGKAVLELRW